MLLSHSIGESLAQVGTRNTCMRVTRVIAGFTSGLIVHERLRLSNLISKQPIFLRPSQLLSVKFFYRCLIQISFELLKFVRLLCIRNLFSVLFHSIFPSFARATIFAIITVALCETEEAIKMRHTF